jgi:hypothetical protein
LSFEIYLQQITTKNNSYLKNLPPKQLIITLIILNLIFFGMFYLLIYTTFFDNWLLIKKLPEADNVCIVEQDGKKVFSFCQ